jgi:hypothetical protein
MYDAILPAEPFGRGKEIYQIGGDAIREAMQLASFCTARA